MASATPVMTNGDSLFSGGIEDRGFLHRLTRVLVDQVMLNLRSAWYPAGAFLTPSLALVFSGRLRYSTRGRNGRILTVHEAVPGDLVGIPLATERGADSSMEVLLPSVLFHLDAKRIMALAARSPDLSAAMLEELGRGSSASRSAA